MTTEIEERYDADGNKTEVVRNFYHVRAKCKKSYSYSEMVTTNLGIFISPTSSCLG
jgi:hypothetical protein